MRARGRARPPLGAHGALGGAGAELADGDDARGEGFREAGDEAFAPVCGREVVDEFILAAEVAGVGIAAVAGDIFEGEIRTAHELVGFLDAEAAKGGLGADAADLDEEAAKVAVGGVNGFGHFFHRGTVREVLGIPREGALDFEIREVGEGGRLELRAVGEGERGEVHETALKTERAEETGSAVVGLEFGGDLLEAGDLGVGEFL